jgi:glycosyltransferase involved in cell wall biosynthesis
MSRILRLLHLHSSFAAGGKELRAAKLMNAFGRGIEHTLVSAEPDQMDAATAINGSINVIYPTDFPALSGRPSPGRLLRLAQAMRGFDLVLTYNWGAMDAVMAHTLYQASLALPPLVHHEDGFNQDEAIRLKPMRTWYRRIALRRAQALVVPSRQLEAIATNVWMLPRDMVHRVANGIPVRAYGGKVRADALPRVIKQKGELWVGTLAGLRPVKNLPRLVRTFATLPLPWQLVILGEGPERDAIRAEAQRLGIGPRVHLPGFARDPARVMGLFDLFALSSDSEQFPISVVEAMAAGLAVAAPRVGDIDAMVSSQNRPYLAIVGDDGALAASLADLAADPELRARIGAANRERALADYDEGTMIAAYRSIYAGAMGRQTFP